MDDDRDPGFRRRRREADERVRRKNLEDRGVSNVVPLRRPKPRREFRLPAWRPNALVLWAGIVAVLIVVYAVGQVF